MLSISQSLVESAELPSIVQSLHQILEQITQWTNKPGLPQGGVEDWCFVVAMVRSGQCALEYHFVDVLLCCVTWHLLIWQIWHLLIETCYRIGGLVKV